MHRGCGDSELDSSTDLSWPKLADQCTYMYMNAADYDHAIYIPFKGSINRVRKVGTSVIQTISLIQYASDKQVQTIKIALYKA